MSMNKTCPISSAISFSSSAAMTISARARRQFSRSADRRSKDPKTEADAIGRTLKDNWGTAPHSRAARMPGPSRQSKRRSLRRHALYRELRTHLGQLEAAQALADLLAMRHLFVLVPRRYVRARRVPTRNRAEREVFPPVEHGPR